MVELQGISVKYPSRKGIDARWILKAVSLTIRPGQNLALVGESGSGKTTLARVLAGVLTPAEGRVVWQPTAGKGKTGLVGYVFQNYTQSLDPRQTVAQAFEESLERRSGKAAVDLEAFVGSLRLEPAVLRLKPHQLSGGMCQRVAIGRAVLLKPDLLIMDESTNALDYRRQVEVVDLVKALQKDCGFSTLWITHDLMVAAYACDSFAFMKAGRIVSEVEGQRALAGLQDPYARRLVELAGQLGGAWHGQSAEV